MQSRDIIIKLIDEGKITGEEAFILINDIIISEVYGAMKEMAKTENKSNGIDWDKGTIFPNVIPTPVPTWPNTAYNITCDATAASAIRQN